MGKEPDWLDEIARMDNPLPEPPPPPRPSPDPITTTGNPTESSELSTADGRPEHRQRSETFRADVRHRALLRGSESSEWFEIGQGGVIGRGGESVQFLLDHPHVSRQHASLTVEGKRVVIADLESSNGTFVNGRQITRADDPGARRPHRHRAVFAPVRRHGLWSAGRGRTISSLSRSGSSESSRTGPAASR